MYCAVCARVRRVWRPHCERTRVVCVPFPCIEDGACLPLRAAAVMYTGGSAARSAGARSGRQSAVCRVSRGAPSRAGRGALSRILSIRYCLGYTTALVCVSVCRLAAGCRRARGDSRPATCQLVCFLETYETQRKRSSLLEDGRVLIAWHTRAGDAQHDRVERLGRVEAREHACPRRACPLALVLPRGVRPAAQRTVTHRPADLVEDAVLVVGHQAVVEGDGVVQRVTQAPQLVLVVVRWLLLLKRGGRPPPGSRRGPPRGSLPTARRCTSGEGRRSHRTA